MQSPGKLTNNPTDQDVSFELWFRPTTFSASSGREPERATAPDPHEPPSGGTS